MDSLLYKDVVTSRGLKYHYYYSPAQPGTPSLLFCHGFPSSPKEWRGIVPHFKEKGYGIIAPEMLGYGGTDKPADPALYVGSAMSKDMTDILDAEKVEKVIAIGHDWGALLVARMANYCPDRVIAYAFMALGYWKPWPKGFTFEDFAAQAKEQGGYEHFGYWQFFNRDDADQVIQAHLESFISVLWPQDPKTWIDRFGATGGFEKSLLEDWTGPTSLTEKEKKDFIEEFRVNKFIGPTCWYKVLVRDLAAADDQNVSPEHKFPPSSSPIFFGAAKLDYIATPALGYATFKDEHFKEGQVTTKEYDSDHWLVYPSHKAEEVSRDLEAWIKGFTSAD